jgi:preprotein translocase subunit SecA
MVNVLPSDDYRRLAVPKPAKLPRGADALAHRASGWWHRRPRQFEALRRDAEAVDAKSGEFEKLDDVGLCDRLAELSVPYRLGREALRPETALEALAAVREAAHRQTGLRPFVVQLMGALALDRGFLAEMATGEGKTLTAALAAVLAGWRGRPCHVITVNDYLAERDAKWFARLYAFAGLTVGCVTSTMEEADRREGYAADVTYTTGKEVVADFLRDRLRLGPIHHPDRRLIRQLVQSSSTGRADLVMRGLHAAIIDEADSLLIDEAVTPLIICQPRTRDSMIEASRIAAELAGRLQSGLDYQVNWRHREVELLDPAFEKLEAAAREMPQAWSGLARRRELVTQALVARELFERNRQYVVQEGKVVIVDEFTGRLMPQRTWREGLHQAIEAKEGLEITAPTEILARLSFQRYYRGYRRLSGMSGTVLESANELWQIYRLPVVAIPTNRPCVRVQLPDRCFSEAESKWQAVVEEIATVHATNRPILVGTRSVLASETLARRLGERGLGCEVLNAIRHAEEARIVARAGEFGRITIATNMAGRGTDILLGKGVAAIGGLHVISTEPNESGRVDRQLSGRAGRQGNPGSARRFFSMEDDLLRRFLPSVLRQRIGKILGGDNAESKAVSAHGAVRYAQFAAQWMAARQRVAVLRNDTWLEEALSFAGPDVGG